MRLLGDYAHAPFVLVEEGGGEQVAAVLRHVWTTRPSVAIGLGNGVDLWIASSFALQSGDAVAALESEPGAAAMGETRFGGTLLFMDQESLKLSGGLTTTIPTGAQASLVGDGALGISGQLNLSAPSPSITPYGSLGMSYRSPRTYLGAKVASEMRASVGVRVPVSTLVVEAELHLATGIRGGRFFKGQTTPVELLVGARHGLGAFVFGGALGLGLSQGIGVPDLRALVHVGVAVDAGLGAAGTSEMEEPSEGASSGPECALGPEDMDGFQDEDGCADPDNDEDGVPDLDDACPLEGETQNGYRDDDGCPDAVELGPSRIELPAPIRFASGSDELDSDAQALLGLLAATLRDRWEFQYIQIEGHASDDEVQGRRRRARLFDLSERRAEAVRTWLVEQGGMDVGRLNVVGVGTEQPLPDRPPEDNRRVEFRAID
jgi:outer membrane protein OmpA-like peptidoglycan-associated protein